MKFIEILIALVLAYAILSILVSLLVERRNSKNKIRGNMLRDAIFQMLDDKLNLNYGQLLINHPLVNSMKNKMENRPFQYLDPGIFADALIDVIGKQSETGQLVTDEKTPKIENTSSEAPNALKIFNEGLKVMNESPFRDMLYLMSIKSQGNYKEFKKSIEDWFNSNMDRTTGWFKRKQQRSLVFFGLLVALLLNIDSIHLIKVISMDENLRKNLVLVAEGVADNYQALDTLQKTEIKEQITVINKNLSKINHEKIDSQYYKTIIVWKDDINKLVTQINYSDSVNELQRKQANEVFDITAQLGLPIGWSKHVAPASWNKIPFKWFNKGVETKIELNPQNRLGQYLNKRNNDPDFGTFLSWLTGIVISGLMLSAGAPFWFDILIKFVNIRKAGIKPSVKIKETQS